MTDEEGRLGRRRGGKAVWLCKKCVQEMRACPLSRCDQPPSIMLPTVLLPDAFWCLCFAQLLPCCLICAPAFNVSSSVLHWLPHRGVGACYNNG